MHLFIPSFFLCLPFVHHTSAVFFEGVPGRLLKHHTGSQVMSCAKNHPCKPKMIQGYMVVPYSIPCSYSFVMDKVHETSIFVGVLVTTVVRELACKYLNVFKNYVNLPYRKTVRSG